MTSAMDPTGTVWALSAYYRFISSRKETASVSTIQGCWKKYETDLSEKANTLQVKLVPADSFSVTDGTRVYESHNVNEPSIRLKEKEDAPDTVVAYHKCKTGVRVSKYEFQSKAIKDRFLQTMRAYRVVSETEPISIAASNAGLWQVNETDSGLQESDTAISQYDSLELRPHRLVQRQNNTSSQVSSLVETQDVVSTFPDTQEVSQSSSSLLIVKEDTPIKSSTPQRSDNKRACESPPEELTRLLKKRRTDLGIPAEVDISVFLRLCLLDPSFPDFVEEIERDLAEVLKAD